MGKENKKNKQHDKEKIAEKPKLRVSLESYDPLEDPEVKKTIEILNKKRN